MKVYLDGQEHDGFFGDGSALSILNVVKSGVGAAGRVVTEIRLDGLEMDEEAFTGVSGGLSVSFTSRPVRGLVVETLDEAVKYMPRLNRGLAEIALHFEKNEISAGEGKLADAADGLDWLLDVFEKTSALLAVDGTGEDGLIGLQKDLTDSINSIATFHSEKKYLQMAYRIRQNLIPELEKFLVYVQRLRDLASSTQ